MSLHRCSLACTVQPDMHAAVIPELDGMLFCLLGAGEMLPLYEELARLLRCNVLSYDYTG